jgi:hypothetical protein
MVGYVGQTRDPDLIVELKAHGVGECTQRGELLSRKREPWFFDNSAYRDWKSGKPFNSMRMTRDLRRISIDREYGNCKRLMTLCGRKLETFCGEPDFIVAPDLVAAGEASLVFSREWLPELEGLPTYLAVQDGMTTARVAEWLRSVRADEGFEFAGIFVGGLLEWKLKTGATWVQFAHALGLRCHIGRVGPAPRVRWARRIGADSIDSCLPLMHKEHMEAFLEALAEA